MKKKRELSWPASDGSLLRQVFMVDDSGATPHGALQREKRGNRNQKREQPKPGPGAQLAALIKAKYKIDGCSTCSEIATMMDALGPDTCRRLRNVILEAMWLHRDQLKGMRGFAAKLPGAKHLALRELSALFDEACQGNAGS